MLIQEKAPLLFLPSDLNLLLMVYDETLSFVHAPIPKGFPMFRWC